MEILHLKLQQQHMDVRNDIARGQHELAKSA